MGEPSGEVIYERRRHASGPSSGYPPQQRIEGGKMGFMSLLSTSAISYFKEKFDEYRHPRKMKKLASLFISQGGKYVAVAAGNQITILRKDDDYQEPHGIFISSSPCTFVYGTWSESHDVLGVVDDSNVLYLIKADGEEFMRVTKSHLKSCSPIIGLIACNSSYPRSSCLCSFNVLTADGLFHDVEITQERCSSSSFVCSSSDFLNLRKQLPQNVVCFDYDPGLDLLVLVGFASGLTSSSSYGSSLLSLWHLSKNFYMEPPCSAQFDGFYSNTKDSTGQMAYPKVLISPHGHFVATLDLSGCMHVFKLNEQFSSLSIFASGKNYSLQATKTSNIDTKFLSGIVDFSWWSGHILALVRRNGFVTMIDILGGLKLQENDLVCSRHVLERVYQFQGQLFLLEITTGKRYNTSNHSETSEGHHEEQVIEGDLDLDYLDLAYLRWNLISLSERSIPTMYNILISNKEYQTALDFADRHGLDKDEVIKSQWLSSNREINEINMFLSNIKDKTFVLSECVDKVGPTEEATKALLAHGLQLTDQYKFTDSNEHECDHIWHFRVERLKLLQFRDRLETYLGINMGRFSVHEYQKFRVMPVIQAAVTFAETGKIGALNLLFKRHPYTLIPELLHILDAIPETLPVHSYEQLLPGRSPPRVVSMREMDWVEVGRTINFIGSLLEVHEISIQIKTENILKLCSDFSWPSVNEISMWYRKRAKDIDSLSGQLDNSLFLIDLGCRRGIYELQQFSEDISYLGQILYAGDSDGETHLTFSLVAWEQLSGYEKFSMMLSGERKELLIERLRHKAIPFMQSRCHNMPSRPEDQETSTNVSMDHITEESFLVKWLKEIAKVNKLDICLMVIEEGCKELKLDGFFRDEIEAADCAMQCIYLCSLTDQWTLMSAILSKLPQTHALKERFKVAEGHVEAGRLLAYYQVPKPMSLFLEDHSDVKGVKHIFRLILSKFIRRQPGRSDNDWAKLWRDMLFLREKAFTFLDQEYMLMEFCRGLLKAGKFSLARNYLKGIGSISLKSAKTEYLVIQAARECFFSASSLTCSEIWKAKECLSLFPSSRNVKAEAGIIEALTVKLPNLGITLLPMQYRQIKDPMEIIKMAITSQPGTYLHVDELIEIAKLLGLSSQDDVSAVEEAVAREAAVAGDLQLAFDLCILLAKKGYGPIWDLCAAMARGPALENVDINSRKQLLGFSLIHCDKESIGELLHAWKNLDMQGQCETLMMLTGSNPDRCSIHSSSFVPYSVCGGQNICKLRDCSGKSEGYGGIDREVHLSNIKNILSDVAENFIHENGNDLELFLRENGKMACFAALELPWLLDLSRKADNSKKSNHSLVTGNQYVNVRTKAVLTILSWLASNGLAPKDNLISSLAKSIIEPPVSEEEDIVGCSFLLNLVDALNGVEIIEEQLRTRKDYQERSSIMNMGLIYSLLHNTTVESMNPAQRRELLMKKFKEKYRSISLDDIDEFDRVQSTFWREWKCKLEEQKHIADHSHVLTQIIPGVDVARFLSGDLSYIENVVFTLIESVKLKHKRILKNVLKLADTYSLDKIQIVQRYLSSILVSEMWTEADIETEISEAKRDILASAVETIDTISSNIYPEISPYNKQRLAFVYSLLYQCSMHLEKTKGSSQDIFSTSEDMTTLELPGFYNVIEQECRRVSFIRDLNFKNIARLDSLNFESFSSEVYKHVNEANLNVLVEMVKNLTSIYTGPLHEGLISWQDVYEYYVLSLLTDLGTRARTVIDTKDPESFLNFICELEKTYDFCRKYISAIAPLQALDIMKKCLSIIVFLGGYSEGIPDTSTWQDCLIVLLNFWIRVTDDMQEIVSRNSLSDLNFDPECLERCLKIFVRLVIEDSVPPNQGWGTIIRFVGCFDEPAVEIFIFLKAMIFSGCGFGAIADVYSEAVSLCPHAADAGRGNGGIQNLPHIYLNFMEQILEELVSDSREHPNLYRLVSSLSALEGDLKDLKEARQAVWRGLAKFANNLQLPSHLRVHVLELMEFISGNNKGFSREIQSNVFPWEGWDKFLCPDKAPNPSMPYDTETSSSFTKSLVALRSSQLVAVISPSIEITPDDLLNTETAISCFLKLCEVASSETHFDALLAILEEWEGLFDIVEETSPQASDTARSWSNDDWDEGWESFPDEAHQVQKEETTRSSSLSVHPLHSCWMEVLKKFIPLSRLKDVIKLMDMSLGKGNVALLEEEETERLCQIVIGIDSFMALKMSLLLPYEAVRLQCLDAVEEKLKREGFSNAIGGDHKLLILVLSSGIISTILMKSSYGNTFSFLCYLVGSFSRKFQEAELSRLGLEGGKGEGGHLTLFGRTLFPCFVSELLKADQHVLAGLLVTKFMHTNDSLGLLNIAEAGLRRYLEMNLQVVQSDDFDPEMMGTCKTLTNSVSLLRGRLRNLLQSSLLSLSTTVS